MKCEKCGKDVKGNSKYYSWFLDLLAGFRISLKKNKKEVFGG